MSELAHILERIGLLQYLDNFVEEGFDSWDTVIYITESDLDALNVKLGHRRRLQREIAHARGISFDQLLAQSNVAVPVQASANPDRSRTGSSSQSEAQPAPSTGPTKRKYRRHPKPDENAPERPSSAYVIFSNQIRDELKPQKLSFTEIAKTVGERWQNLTPEQKEPYESQANSAKDVYNREMAKYKKTPQYSEYTAYLTKFRAKNPGPGAGGDGKRTRLDKEVSRPSSGSKLSTPSAGSPIDSTFEPTALFRPPPLPSGPSGSSASSASPTSNLPPGGGPPPLPNVGVSASAGLASRHHHQQQQQPPQLPRIVPLEPGEAGHLSSKPPLHLESDPYSRPRAASRRTVGTATAPFLRHDTSKSSVSSNISGGSVAGSTGSSTFTPITPVEEGHHLLHTPQQRASAFHPPPPPPQPSGHGFSLPPLAQATATPPGPYQPQPPPSHHYRSTSSPMKRLSIEDEHSAGQPSSAGIHSSGGTPAGDTVTSPRSAMSVTSDRPEHSPGSEDSSARENPKLDPLSVLALAGNMMDRRPGPPSGSGERRERDRNR